MIVLIGLCAFLAVALVALATGRALSARRMMIRERIALIAGDGQLAAADRRSRGLLRSQNYSSMPLLQRLLQHSPRAERIADDLDRAGLSLRVGEYLALSIAVGLALALAARLLLPSGIGGLAGMVVGALLGLLIPRWFVSRRIRRRRAAIEANLPDALDMIARSLRAGTGLLAGIEAMAEQIGGAIGAEFTRMRQEISAGIAVEDALNELDRRVSSPDLHIVVMAMVVQREVGGSLAEIMGNVASTVRERARLRREMRVLTSMQRYSSYVIAAVPIFIFFALTAVNPAMTRNMLSHTGGWVVLGIAATFELAGFLALRWLTSSLEV